MSYCINPKCPHRLNADWQVVCQSCGTALRVQQRYRLIKPLRELNEQSQTEVFSIEDRGTAKVLKVLKNPQLVQMFEREALVLQQLQHASIPKVEPDGYFSLQLNAPDQTLHCLVMEQIDGKTLEQWLLQHGPLSDAMALDWLRQLVEVLARLHENKLFHRDIKLSNIMLRPNGQLVLIDFGTIRPVTDTYLAKVGGGRDVTGIVSPGYTPLEQVNGKAVPQSDFYALGRSFVYLLTGKHPLDLAEDAQTGALAWHDSAPQASLKLATLLDDLMAPFPGNRPLNTQAIVQRLETATLPAAKVSAQQVRLSWLIAMNIGLLALQLVTGLLWLQTKQSFERGGDRALIQLQ